MENTGYKEIEDYVDYDAYNMIGARAKKLPNGDKASFGKCWFLSERLISGHDQVVKLEKEFRWSRWDAWLLQWRVGCQIRGEFSTSINFCTIFSLKIPSDTLSES